MKFMSVKNLAGFTILEIMIYVALVSVVMVVMAQFAVDVIQNAVRARVVKEVELNTQLTLNRIVSEIRHAKSISLVTATSLTLIDASDTTVILRYDWANTEVEREVAGAVESITTPDVRVTALNFSAVREGVTIDIAVAQGPVNLPPAYTHQTNLSATVFPRQLWY